MIWSEREMDRHRQVQRELGIDREWDRQIQGQKMRRIERQKD
jgi:hypothetical protein